MNASDMIGYHGGHLRIELQLHYCILPLTHFFFNLIYFFM